MSEIELEGSWAFETGWDPNGGFDLAAQRLADGATDYYSPFADTSGASSATIRRVR